MKRDTRARQINAAVRNTSQAAYLRPAGIRILRARTGPAGHLEVQALCSGKWITTIDSDNVYIGHATPSAIIQGGRQRPNPEAHEA